MRHHLVTAVLYTIVTTVLFGLAYPLAVTAAAQLLFHNKANGQLIYASDPSAQPGQLIGSSIIGQPFTAPAYFHSRPSAAGTGYDAANSGGSNLAPTNRKLIERIADSVDALKGNHPDANVPIDLVTASASGLDPDITPAAAEFQVARVASARHLSDDTVRQLILRNTKGRQLGFLGEPRVNVLALNLDLDRLSAR